MSKKRFFNELIWFGFIFIITIFVLIALGFAYREVEHPVRVPWAEMGGLK